jgi:hypothetical protein
MMMGVNQINRTKIPFEAKTCMGIKNSFIASLRESRNFSKKRKSPDRVSPNRILVS